LNNLVKLSKIKRRGTLESCVYLQITERWLVLQNSINRTKIVEKCSPHSILNLFGKIHCQVKGGLDVDVFYKIRYLLGDFKYFVRRTLRKNFITCKTALEVVIKHLTPSQATKNSVIFCKLALNEFEEMVVVYYPVVVCDVFQQNGY
jgi:hypothetical protein